MSQGAFCGARGTAAMSVRQLGRSELGQQRRSKATRTLVRSTPISRHADRQRILRLGAKSGLMHPRGNAVFIRLSGTKHAPQRSC